MDHIEINDRKIGSGYPVYIVAEISANHAKDIRNADMLIEMAKNSGADAVKLQTYTPDTLTIDSDDAQFAARFCWNGEPLYELYKEAYTPWEWHEELFDIAKEVGITIFSTAYDATSVDFLEGLNTPAYKIASFELVDIPLLEYVAKTKKPIILSTGMASLSEVDEAVATLYRCGNKKIALLKCTSAYPARVSDMNLRGMSALKGFNVPVGLSDHSTGLIAPIVATAFGASIIEKHIMLDDTKTPDTSFSLNSFKFQEMVKTIRDTEKSLGSGVLSPTISEQPCLMLRKSIYVVKDVEKGDFLTKDNIRVIRPGGGMHPREYKTVLGRQASRKLFRGRPLMDGDVI